MEDPRRKSRFPGVGAVSGARRAITVLPACLVVMLSAAVQAQDHGVPVDTYPAWQERAIEVLINAARISPQDFRDEYLQYPEILQPAVYPPVPPLFWCEELNHAARYHSEDMASCDQLSHTSCDGTPFTTRVAGFYPYTPIVGEVIMAGSIATPLLAVVMWLEDGGAADGSGLDGHRQMIMRQIFTEGGGGYCEAPATLYRRFITYDFGSRDRGDPPPLADGAHLFLTTGTTDFWANWYDPEGSAPRYARVFVDGECHELTLHLGAATAGTWTVALPSATACRSYTFQFVDGGGTVHWYPATGALRTRGEGSCTEDYLAGTSGVLGARAPGAQFESVAPNPFNPLTTIRFRLDQADDVRLTVVDLQGRLVRTLLVAYLGEGVHEVAWDGRDDAGRAAGSGLYLARLADGNGGAQVAKLTLVR